MTETSPLAASSYLSPIVDRGEGRRFPPRRDEQDCSCHFVDVRMPQGDNRTMRIGTAEPSGGIQVKGPTVALSSAACRARAAGSGRTTLAAHGDVAAMDGCGFVRVADRTQGPGSVGRRWISSVNLENTLMAHPAITEAAVIADPDQVEQHAGVHRLEEGADRFGGIRPFAQLADLLDSFAKWRLPDRYEVIDSMPRTSTGRF